MVNSTLTKQDPALDALMKFAPTIKSCFFNDVTISISNLTEVIYQLNATDINNNNQSVGKPLQGQDPMLEVIRKKKPIQLTIPKELYGFAMRLAIAPIFNDANQLVGTISVSRNNSDQSNLVDVAKTFTESSNQLNNSANELTSLSNTLAHYMDDVSNAQENLSTQMVDSTKILDMINNVAKNTRILGFNAGIEAARSGEHGKGFAVVAKEITKLADQTADSVNDIQSVLSSMRAKVDEITSTIQNTIELADSQVHATTDIANALDRLSTVAETIDQLAKKM